MGSESYVSHNFCYRTYDDINDKHQREEEEEYDMSVDMALWSV